MSAIDSTFMYSQLMLIIIIMPGRLIACSITCGLIQVSLLTLMS